jgi:hypothetical protein
VRQRRRVGQERCFGRPLQAPLSLSLTSHGHGHGQREADSLAQFFAWLVSLQQILVWGKSPILNHELVFIQSRRYHYHHHRHTKDFCCTICSVVGCTDTTTSSTTNSGHHHCRCGIARLDVLLDTAGGQQRTSADTASVPQGRHGLSKCRQCMGQFGRL